MTRSCGWHRLFKRPGSIGKPDGLGLSRVATIVELGLVLGLVCRKVVWLVVALLVLAALVHMRV
jgi:hypothetical protein